MMEKIITHLQRHERWFILDPNMSEHDPENTDSDHSQFPVPTRYQLDEIFIVTEQRKSRQF